MTVGLTLLLSLAGIVVWLWLVDEAHTRMQDHWDLADRCNRRHRKTGHETTVQLHKEETV